MKTPFFKNRTALVTGGSSGIGLAIALELSRQGAALVLTATNAAKLEQAADLIQRESGKRPLTLAFDLSDPSAPAALLGALAEKKITVDILVNNAGFGTLGPFVLQDVKEQLRMVDVNVRAVLELSHLFGAGMRERGSGWILNVASTAAFQSIPLEATYAASKAFVLTFSVALHEELRSHGVAVSCLCPGATETPFFSRGGFRKASKMYRMRMAVGPVARAGVEGMKRNKALVIAGLHNRAGAFATRLAPRTLAAKVAKKVVE